jgi:uncharacterized protein YodC (DUF2158 family)
VKSFILIRIESRVRLSSEVREMAKQNIQKGDIVVLKSGGPKMTVQSIGEPRPGMAAGTKWVHCIWFEGNVINEYNFDDCVLKILDNDTDGD